MNNEAEDEEKKVRKKMKNTSHFGCGNLHFSQRLKLTSDIHQKVLCKTNNPTEFREMVC